MSTPINKVMPSPGGRVQRIVLKELQNNSKLTTSELAKFAYGRDGEFENHHVIRAINGLTKRGYSFTKIRKGRVNATGYVYVWSLI